MPDLFANNALRTRYVRRVSISILVPYHHVFSNRYEIDPPSPLTHTHVDLHPPPLRLRGWSKASQTPLPDSLVELEIDQELNTPHEVLTILKSPIPVD